LDRALGPTVLLAFERGDLHGQLGRRYGPWKEDEAPARELRTVGEIEVLGQGVVLPAPGLLDAATPPDARGPVEVEEFSGEVSRGVFDEEMTVQQESLNAREKRVVAVEVSPASLDHPDARVREPGYDLEQEAGRRDEVRVEDG